MGSGRVRRAGRRIARFMLAGVLVLGVAGLLLVAAVGVIAQTGWGRAWLLERARPLLQQTFPGGADVGGLEGNLLTEVVLRDVVVRDRDGVEAVRIARLALAWRPGRLIFHDVVIARADAQGARVQARRLRDGRWNLVALTRPARHGGAPWAVRVDEAQAVVDVRAEDGEVLPWRVAATGRLGGSLLVTPAIVRVDIRSLDLGIAAPFTGHLGGHARVTAREGRPPRPARIDGALTLETDGEALSGRLPWLGMQGPLVIALHGEGTTGALDVRASVRPARGELVAEGRIVRSATGLSWEGRATARALDPAFVVGLPHGVLDGTAQGQGSGRRYLLRVPRVKVRVGDSKMAATAELRSPERLSGRLEIEGDLGRLLALLPGTHRAAQELRGPVRGRAEVIRARGRWTVQARLAGRSLGMPGLRIGTATATVRLQGLRGSAMLDAREVSAAGRAIDRVQLDLVGDSRSFSVGFAARGAGVQVAAEAHALRRGSRIQGSLERLLVRAGEGAAPGWTLTAPAHVVVGAGAVRVERLRLVRGAQRVLVDGALYHRRLDGRLALRQVDLGALARFLRPSLRVPAIVTDADLRVSGTRASPSVRGSLSASLEGAGERVRVQGDVGWERHRLEAAVNARAVGGGTVRARAALPLPLDPRAPIQIALAGRSLSIRRLLGLARPRLSASDMAIDGALDVQLHADGTLAAPALELSVDGAALSAGPVRPIAVHATSGYRAGQATLEGTVGVRGAELLRVRGHTELDLGRAIEIRTLPELPLSIDVSAVGYDLRRLRGAGRTLSGLAGLLRGHAVVAGRLRAPTVRGELHATGLSDGRVTFDAVDATGSWDGSQAGGTVRARQRSGGTLAFDGRFTPGAGTMFGRVDVVGFDLSFIPALVPAFRGAGGVVEAHLQLSGTTTAPSAAGTIRLRNGSILLLEDTQRYTGITLAANLSPGRLDLRNLEARSRDGTLRGSGALSLSGWQPKLLDLVLSARAFALSFGGTLVTRLDGKLQVHAERVNGELRGRVTVSEGKLELPPLTARGKNLQPLGPLEDVVFVDEEARRGREHPRAAPFPIQAELRLPGAFALRGKDVQSDVHGELRISIAGAKVAVRGLLESTGGWVDLFGSHLSIEHARFEWSGPDPADPGLNIRLARSYGDATVYVDVTGTARKPQIGFSSDPPRYSRTEIIGILVSGDPGNVTVDERSLDQRVVGALSGAVIGTIKERLLPGLPIDVLKVQLGGEGAAGLGATRLEVGKYFTRNIYVSYVHLFGAAPQSLVHYNTNQVTVEWRFARRFQLDTTYGDAGVGGVDFAFRLRF